MSNKNTLENKKSRKLERELMAYSLAAGTVLLGAAGVNATVHHTDLGAGVVLDADGETLDIDFDGGGSEFTIFFGTVSYRVNVDFGSANASWRGGNGFGTGGTAAAGAVALDFGNNVNSGAQWGHESIHETTSTYGNMAFDTSWGTGTGGSFLGTSGKYLGVRFDISGNTHYGWIQVNVPGGTFPTSATITGYAYEDIADKQITAGAIPEPGSLALLALGAAGLAAWRKK